MMMMIHPPSPRQSFVVSGEGCWRGKRQAGGSVDGLDQGDSQ
jgi:hypothetical protein